MDQKEALERLLRSYQRYYDIRTEGVEPPFAAEAVFHSHDDSYFLIKAARISSQESHEYVYFAAESLLDRDRFNELDAAAWERGISQVVPYPDHRSSDVTLVILADRIEPDVCREIRRRKHYKSYQFRLQGWSSYRLIALELSTGKITHNRLGESLKKLIRNI